MARNCTRATRYRAKRRSGEINLQKGRRGFIRGWTGRTRHIIWPGEIQLSNRYIVISWLICYELFSPLPSPAFLCALHARNPAQPPFLFSVVFNIGSRTISPLPRHTSCAKSWLRNLRFRPFLSNNDRKEEARDPAQSLPSSVKMSPSECLMTESS